MRKVIIDNNTNCLTTLTAFFESLENAGMLHPKNFGQVMYLADQFLNVLSEIGMEHRAVVEYHEHGDGFSIEFNFSEMPEFTTKDKHELERFLELAQKNQLIDRVEMLWEDNQILFYFIDNRIPQHLASQRKNLLDTYLKPISVKSLI